MQILYPILSAIFFAFVGFFTKVLVTKSEKPLVSAFWFNVLAAIFFVPFFIFEKPTWHFSTTSLILLLTSIAAYTAYTIFGFKSNKYLDVSITGVLSQITLIFSFIGSIIIFNEDVTLQKIIGVGLILSGNILLFIKGNKTKRISTIGVALRVLAAVTLAGALLIDAKNSSKFTITFYAFLVYLFPGIFTLLYSRSSLKDAEKEFINNKLGLLVTAFSGTLAYYFLIKSFAEVDKTIVVPINNSYTVILVVMGIIFLKETNDKLKKIFAALLVFIGVVVVGLA